MSRYFSECPYGGILECDTLPSIIYSWYNVHTNMLTNTVPVIPHGVLFNGSLEKGRQVSDVSIMSVARGGDVTGNTTVPVGRPQSRYLLLAIVASVQAAWIKR